MNVGEFYNLCADIGYGFVLDVEGSMILRIGDTRFDGGKGDSWCIPMNVQHGAQILEDSVAVEVFTVKAPNYFEGCAPLTAERLLKVLRQKK